MLFKTSRQRYGNEEVYAVTIHNEIVKHVLIYKPDKLVQRPKNAENTEHSLFSVTLHHILNNIFFAFAGKKYSNFIF